MAVNEHDAFILSTDCGLLGELAGCREDSCSAELRKFAGEVLDISASDRPAGRELAGMNVDVALGLEVEDYTLNEAVARGIGRVACVLVGVVAHL